MQISPKKRDGSIYCVVSGCGKLTYKEEIFFDLGEIWSSSESVNFEVKDEWMTRSQEVFYREFIRSCGASVFRLTNWPDLIVADKNNRTCKMIDFALSGYIRGNEKEKKKTKISKSI